MNMIFVIIPLIAVIGGIVIFSLSGGNVEETRDAIATQNHICAKKYDNFDNSLKTHEAVYNLKDLIDLHCFEKWDEWNQDSIQLVGNGLRHPDTLALEKEFQFYERVYYGEENCDTDLCKNYIKLRELEKR